MTQSWVLAAYGRHTGIIYESVGRWT